MSRKSRADRFIDLVTLNYDRAGDVGPHRFDEAAKILAKKPDIVRKSIHAAAAAGDVSALEAWKKEKPRQLDKPGGPFGWTPLMYAAYARPPGHSTLDAGLWLLDNGADPNAFHLSNGQYVFTVLTGVFGHGEAGPVNLPEHPDMKLFARVLLEHGANPNDSQAAYNRCFLPDNTCLEMLLEFGLTASDRNNWQVEHQGALVPNPNETLHFHLIHAIRSGFADRVRLLVNHGADINNPDDTYATRVKGRTPYEAALLMGFPEIADFLLQRGAKRSKLSPPDRFEAACMAGDLAAAERLLRGDPGLLEEIGPHQREMLCSAAGNGSKAALETMIALGFELSEPGGRTPLHEAAWRGDIRIAELLIGAGADPLMSEPVHGAAAIGFAAFARQQEMVDFLKPYGQPE
ncbi:MAG: ankyrin repeat domain-containing protein [Pseudomonadota bacterium]